jgi:23S rRNA (uracil1939-C5)-methyltransferase
MTATRITKMLYGGAGATDGGAATPFVLPGELVEIDPANGLRILEPSPDRTAPACIHFGTCGGCHYQHASYAAQLRIKEAILRDTFSSAGLTELPGIELHSGPGWHYRNRIRLRVDGVEGELRVGYNRHNATGGDAMLSITMCPIAAPLLWRAASTLMETARAEPAARAWLSSAVEIECFTNADETALQLTLFTRNPPKRTFASFCAAVQRALPQLTGAGVAILPKQPSPQGRRAEHPRPGPQWGTPGLVYRVDEVNHWVGRGGFFQVNRFLVSTLARLATAGRTGALAWDLYAGVGLFSRALADRFDRVVAIEAAEPAATNLRAALASAANGKNHRAIAATTLDFLKTAVVQRERPQLIVMDPPRAGVGPEVCALLGRIRAPELVYVSCDPVTLARDLRLLTGSGYGITELHLVDMFPQTFHMEAVAVLRL